MTKNFCVEKQYFQLFVNHYQSTSQFSSYTRGKELEFLQSFVTGWQHLPSSYTTVMQHYIPKNLDNHVQVALSLPLKLQMPNEQLYKHKARARVLAPSLQSLSFSFPSLLKGDILYSQLHLGNVTATLGHLLIWVTISDYFIDQDYFKFTYCKFSPPHTFDTSLL